MWMFCVLQVWLSLTKPRLASRLAQRCALPSPSPRSLWVLLPVGFSVLLFGFYLSTAHVRLLSPCAAPHAVPSRQSLICVFSGQPVSCPAHITGLLPSLLRSFGRCNHLLYSVMQAGTGSFIDREYTLPCASSGNPEAGSGRKIWPFCCKPKCIFISKYPQISLSWVKLDPHSVREEKKTTKQPEAKALCFWTNKR